MTFPNLPRPSRAGPRRCARHRPARALLCATALVLAGCAGLSPPRPGGPPPAPAPGAPPAAPPTAPAPPSTASTRAPGTDTPGDAPAGPAPNARTAGAEMLAIEQRWLQDWFRGTPVRIGQRSDGTLAIDVPREFCFDAGRSQVRPALGAVLDKVAESLRRRPGTRLTLLSAPGDAAGSPAAAALALQRAAMVHRHLRERGVAPARLGEPVAEGSSAVQLRIVATAAPASGGVNLR